VFVIALHMSDPPDTIKSTCSSHWRSYLLYHLLHQHNPDLQVIILGGDDFIVGRRSQIDAYTAYRYIHKLDGPIADIFMARAE
jgi:hypothetical protein